jgi:hypothetical protein
LAIYVVLYIVVPKYGTARTDLRWTATHDPHRGGLIPFG